MQLDASSLYSTHCRHSALRLARTRRTMISRAGGGVRGEAASLLLPLSLLALSLLPPTLSNPVGSATAGGAITSTYKPGQTCSVGDVVYLPGDEVPGREACERCECGARGALQCRRRTCEQRPGCKALHRPDECCPQYQCECELDGRVYANGEKLVDPVDPCKVCYCQGGEVVCRRIACFLRNDCEPRLVPGRCCPEYDHCPLRGVTTEAGKSSAITTSVGGANVNKLDNITQKVGENVKKEITIKEVTPVSEIPAVVSGIRIKEVPPSPVAEMTLYSTSIDSPKQTSTVTTQAHTSPPTAQTQTEGTVATIFSKIKPSDDKILTDAQGSTSSTSPSTGAIMPRRPSDIIASSTVRPPLAPTTYREQHSDHTTPQDQTTSQAPLEILNEITFSSSGPVITSNSSPSPTPDEEDTGFELVNPAFPPLPDDLSQPNHDDSESTDLHEHPSPTHTYTSLPHEPTFTTGSHAITETQATTTPPKTDNRRVLEDLSKENRSSVDRPLKTSPLLNLRSALPIEILDIPSSLPEVITGDLDVEDEVNSSIDNETQSTTVTIIKPVDSTTSKIEISSVGSSDDKLKSSPSRVLVEPTLETKHLSTPSEDDSTETPLSTKTIQETTLNFESIVTTANTEEMVDGVTSTTLAVSTEAAADAGGTDVSSALGPVTNPPEVVQILYETTTAKNIEISKKTEAPEATSKLNDRRTESSVTMSSPVAEVEVLREVNVDESHSAAIVRASGNHNNVLTDLINLVGDVASIGERTERPEPTSSSPKTKNEERSTIRVGGAHSISNAVTATERQPVAATVEISDDDIEIVTDSAPPLDRVEPTTRRPLIDNVSDARVPSGGNGNSDDKKDIEIIGQSYVPTISRRPTKVVMKKKSERVESAPSASPGPSLSPDTLVAADSTPAPATSTSSASS